MTNSDFEKAINEQIDYCKTLLVAKGEEYSNSRDRLIAFKTAAAVQGISQKEALCGMMAKHTVSIYDMCNLASPPSTKEKWIEKITDNINYLLILRAMIEEDFADGQGS